jgi:NHLM bacteriocin system ABC transporter peptidase/ATP-binding protein
MTKSETLWRNKRTKTPTVLQMEYVEDGAACLAMILGYYGRIVPLGELRRECGVTRDGTKPSYVVNAAKKYGLMAKQIHVEPEELHGLPLPMIVLFIFNDFIVLEGIRRGKVYLNDPGSGPRVMSQQEFNETFIREALTFEPGPGFEKGGKKPSVIRALKERFIGAKAALTYVILAGLFLVVPGLVIPTFSKIFVDNILVGKMHDWLGPLLLGMALAGLMRGALTWLQKHYLLRLETKLALSSSARFFLHVFHLPVEFFNQRFGGEIANRVQINDRVAQLLSGDLASNTLAALMVVFYVALMLQYDVLLTLVGVLVVMLNLAALRYFSEKRSNSVSIMLQAQGKGTETLMSGLQMIESVKASGSESDFFSQWTGYQAQAKNTEQELGVSSQLLDAVPPLLSSLNYVATLSLGAIKIMKGQLSMGELIAFQSLMFNFVGPFNQMVDLGGQLQEVRGDMNRLEDVLGNPLDERFTGGAERPQPRMSTEVKLSGQLELRDITFGYSKHEPPLIEAFSLTLRPGARVALVGKSGSGKSTMAKLVTGLNQPWSGEILFDGKPRNVIPRHLLTSSIAMVDQDIFMFEGTVRENLTLWDSTVPESNVMRAAKDADIHETIAERVGGYDSEVAEGCSNFSGGQRQRLEIARALVGDPTVLVLDEATSALDPKTEKTVDDNIRRRGCTCVIIAHRLSTIRDCDEIIVLEGGKVVQRGTHDEMRNVDGPYARLIEED